METDATARTEDRPPGGPADAVAGGYAGVRAGGYTLERELGRGGMATVYLARDPKHDRQVAVKVLAAEFTALLGAERFVQEIRVTAHLQHTHVLGLLDSGVFGPEAGGLAGRPYYVMPYVAGPTLRRRLDREGALPVPEAVRLAQEVASALEYAHRHGVVHRDVKPENILLQEGSALVADFGIALAVEQAGGARMTQTGFSLGTPQYMAPEQAMGERQITARTDLYALGAVTYEMLAGEPPFTGATVQAVVARVMTEAPRSLTAQRPSVPPHVDAAVRRALEKLPGDRFGSAREFAQALAEPVGAPAGALPTGRGAPVATAARARGRPAVVTTLLAAALAGGAVGWLAGHRRAGPPPRPMRFVLDELRDSAVGGSPALSPAGGTIVVAGAGEGGGLLVRTFDDLRARTLPGTAGARQPFVSPDGRSVGFVSTDEQLERVSLDGGGAPTVIAPASRFSTGSWGPDGTIVVDRSGGPLRGGLARVDATSGTLRALTRPDSAGAELFHTAPHVLPDGKAVAFTVIRRVGGLAAIGELAVVPLDAKAAGPVAHTRLGLNSRTAVGVVDGRLVYVAPDGGGLMAAPFDEAGRRVTGPPAVVLRDPEGGIWDATLARDGTLLYKRAATSHPLSLVDARGAARPVVDGAPLAEHGYTYPRLSPDGRRLAVVGPSPNGRSDIWVYDLASGTPTRLTTSGAARGPEWTPDGGRIVFNARDGGGSAFWAQPADGSAPAERLVAAGGFGGVTPDGRALVFEQRAGNGVSGIWSAAIVGDSAARVPRPVLAGPSSVSMPAVSRDGRWLAYVSTESGREQVYVRPFPGPGAAVQVSEGGGTEPVWAPDGRRLLYRTGRDLVAATVGAAPAGVAGAGAVVARREALFRDAFAPGGLYPNYAVAPDGQHFVLFGGGGGRGPEAVVVVNWLSELRAALHRGPRPPAPGR